MLASAAVAREHTGALVAIAPAASEATTPSWIIVVAALIGALWWLSLMLYRSIQTQGTQTDEKPAMVDNSTQTDEEPPPSTTDGLGALLVDELRAVLKQRGLPTSGAKAALVDRVLRSSRATYSPSIAAAQAQSSCWTAQTQGKR